jgi:hypothetical protein
MQFFTLLLCALMSSSALTAQTGRGSIRQRRSLGHEIKENWMIRVSHSQAIPIVHYPSRVVRLSLATSL